MLRNTPLENGSRGYSEEYRLLLKNTTDYDFDSVGLVYKTYREDSTIIGSGYLASLNDFRRGNASEATLYLSDEFPARMEVRARFSMGEKNYQTAFVEIPLGDLSSKAGVSVEVLNTLPASLTYKDYRGNLFTYSITDVRSAAHSSGVDYWLTITLAGTCVSGVDNTAGALGYRITDASGTVFEADVVGLTKLSPGENFDNVKIDVYPIPAGEYVLELVDYDSSN